MRPARTSAALKSTLEEPRSAFLMRNRAAAAGVLVKLMTYVSERKTTPEKIFRYQLYIAASQNLNQNAQEKREVTKRLGEEITVMCPSKVYNMCRECPKFRSRDFCLVRWQTKLICVCCFFRCRHSAPPVVYFPPPSCLVRLRLEIESKIHCT